MLLSFESLLLYFRHLRSVEWPKPLEVKSWDRGLERSGERKKEGTVNMAIH